MHRRRFAALAGASALLAPALARGQAGWKADKPITIYNPFAAGGGTDIHIRLMGETAGRSGETLISVRSTGKDAPRQFEVVIRDWSGETHYQVTMSAATFERLSGASATPEECVHAAFRFLLDREPKDSILRRFDVSVIERYFPEFFREFPRYRDE